ncbi:MAG TPA: serine hydrolase domain-containing protein, partial [Hyphomicrobiales bacterium]|nr:serine hydrolase domain-containing protein [Hyphomicrobiales bacterium]
MNSAGTDVRLAAFEAAAQAAVDSGGVPSVVGMAADRERILYANAIGALGVPGASALDMGDVFLLASMTKPITGFAAALLIEQGKLDLDQEAAAIVPEIARLKVLTGFDEAGRPQLRDPVRPIRLRHLFTHSSGISTDVWNPMIARYKAEN